jgi:alpha-2-macroglobulin
MEAAVRRDIERLSQLQNDDGGFPVWTKGRESWPFYSIHVAHALHRAADKGFEVPQEMQRRVLDHIRDIERYYHPWYSPQTRHALSAYAVYVRALMGDVDTVKARNLLNQYSLEEQSLEAIAWLWQVLSNDPASTRELEAIRRHILNRAVETPSAANFVTSYGDDAYLMLHSNRRTDAIILDALIQDQPESDLIPKVVTGLLAHRSAGRWNNTQENVFVLLALDRYFNTFESVTPDFVANFWLGDVYAGGHEFEGYTTETRQTNIPMRYLTDEEEFGEIQDLVIAKEGDGRLYYRLGMRYAPTSLELDPLEMGFVVQRAYEAIDDPDDVVRDEDGVWRIKAGARVRVTLNMVAPSRRYHVALVDPLPAGLEIINPALAVSESVPQDPNVTPGRWWWWGPWYEHQNLRDQRAEAFATLLWDGVYDYSYVARATTPGEFVVPPAKAEEMYSPEVFGRSATDRVIVE